MKNKIMRLCCIIFCIIIISGMSACEKKDDNAGDEPQKTENTQTDVVPENTYAVADVDAVEFFSYSGMFYEDGDFREVKDVAAISVRNLNNKTLQYGVITETFPDGTVYTYEFSTVRPGQTLKVCEKNASPFKEKTDDTEIRKTTLAYFRSEPGFNDDVLGLYSAPGGFTVVNESESDITGKIYVYYKCCVDSEMIGGRTFRVAIEGGIKKGEMIQKYPTHFLSDGSVIVYTEIEASAAEVE